jgi:hypothetical protein
VGLGKAAPFGDLPLGVAQVDQQRHGANLLQRRQVAAVHVLGEERLRGVGPAAEVGTDPGGDLGDTGELARCPPPVAGEHHPARVRWQLGVVGGMESRRRHHQDRLSQPQCLD